MFSNLPANNNIFSNNSKKNDSDEEGDDEAEAFYSKQSEGIIGFKPDEDSKTSDFEKLFVRSVDSMHSLSKELGKYVSKGKGFISLEKHKENGSGFVIFRNSMGKKLLEGVFTGVSRHADKSANNHKNIASFGVFEVEEGKPVLRFCKIPVSVVVLLLC